MNIWVNTMWNIFISTILSFSGTNCGTLLTTQDICLWFIPPGASAPQPLPLTTSRPFVMYKGNENIYEEMSLSVTLLTAGRRAFVRKPRDIFLLSFILVAGCPKDMHAAQQYFLAGAFFLRALSHGAFCHWNGTGSRIIPLAFPGNSKSSGTIAGSLFWSRAQQTAGLYQDIPILSEQLQILASCRHSPVT